MRTQKQIIPTRQAKSLAVLASAGFLSAAMLMTPVTEIQPTHSVIVQGKNLAAVKLAVEAAGGTISHELGVIRGVAVELSNAQMAKLRSTPGITRIFDNTAVETAARRVKQTKKNGQNSTTTESSSLDSVSISSVDTNANGQSADTHFPTLIDADVLHQQGIDGSGVTVAVLDSGVWIEKGVATDSNGADRILARYDAIQGNQLRGESLEMSDDDSGHGTHVASIAVSSRMPDSGKFNGIAPNSNLVVVKAFNTEGRGTYADVIRGIDWLVKKKSRHNIRVLNLSLSATPQSHYWDDPLNQAVMAAWKAGIVVVASAGNTGPDPMTIGVPGNVPYVITVGAMTDNFTPADGSDDLLATFSAAGPTHEGFLKPEIVAPGGHLLGIMKTSSQIAKQHPQFHSGAKYFSMSGTSQSAAVVTGVAALMLQEDPTLSADDVKCRLMASARPAITDAGNLVYSPFQQGAGMVNAYDAVYSTASDCANQSLNIENDLAGEEHYAGTARQDADGNFYIEGYDDFLWDGSLVKNKGLLKSNGFLWTDGFIWNDGFLWTDGFVWNDGFLWTDGFVWNDGFVWSNGFLWTDAQVEQVSINAWVEQE